jgi:zinc transport system substrate-binding protein
MHTSVVNHLFLFISLLSLLFSTPTLAHASEKRILVSVAPYTEITKEIAGNSFEVILIVPPGLSSHSFEPTPKQIFQASKASIWFCIGESFEPKMLKAFESQDPGISVVDLRTGIPLIKDSHDESGELHEHSGYDPHIWMSPKLMQEQAKTIAHSIVKLYPEYKKEITQNLDIVLEKLDSLDRYIRKTLSTKKSLNIFVSHPAYGYFCKEYGLHEYSIEQEGKDPSPKQLTELIKKAKKDNIHTIFSQNQYSIKGAEQVAKAIGANLVCLNPYSEQYFDAMRTIADAFAKSLSATTIERDDGTK